MHTQNSIVQKLQFERLQARNIRVLVKRDDLIHEEISGNKWRKLKYNLELCRVRKKNGILTFGGAYSNHLVATAAACKEHNVQCIGLVRGEELHADSNTTLQRCAELGMELRFISREEYAMRNDSAYHETLAADFPSFQRVPEGGANYYGMIGCQEILKEVDEPVDHLFVAQGTTTTSCGIMLSLQAHQTLHVVPVLKGFVAKEEMLALFAKSGMEASLIEDLLNQVEVHDAYHFGGYGKYTTELLDFIRSIYTEQQLKLDPIYTGKAFYAMLQELESHRFDNSTVLFVHTGGLQGAKGIEEKSGTKLFV